MSGLIIAQALVEHGMLDSMAAGLTRARYQIDAYLGQDGSTYVLVGAVVVVLFLITRRRR